MSKRNLDGADWIIIATIIAITLVGIVGIIFSADAHAYDPCDYVEEIERGDLGYPVPEGWDIESCYPVPLENWDEWTWLYWVTVDLDSLPVWSPPQEWLDEVARLEAGDFSQVEEYPGSGAWEFSRDGVVYRLPWSCCPDSLWPTPSGCVQRFTREWWDELGNWERWSFQVRPHRHKLNGHVWQVVGAIPGDHILGTQFHWPRWSPSYDEPATEYPPDAYYCVSSAGTKTNGVSTSDIESFAWADADCYGSISEAVAQLQGGDQLWIDDGTYSEAIRLRVDHSGSPEDYTIVRARNPGQVILTGEAYGQVLMKSTSYVEVEGLKLIDCDLPFYVTSESHHFKIKRCAWNRDTALITAGSSFGLMEDCYAWGGPHRYPFQTSNGAHHIVYRRCLVRWDYSNVTEPTAAFASYTCDNIHYQNCIVINGTDWEGADYSEDGAKGFFTPNGSTNTSYEGCMVLACEGFAGWQTEGTNADVTLTDCLVWDLAMNSDDATDSYKPKACSSGDDVLAGMFINRCTFGLVEYPVSSPLGFEFAGSIGEYLYNSIIYGMDLDDGVFAVGKNLDDGDYNCYFANSADRSGGIGPNSITNLDPLAWPELLETAGIDGSRIGARIETRIGAAGSVYGDPGWNADTGEALWPWPHEEQIREDCRSFYRGPGEAYEGSPEMIGARGFCAEGETLTGYIQSREAR